MPRCIQCRKWGLFLKLQDGRCPSCYSNYCFHVEQFQNLQRILMESLCIIRKTKYLDTLLGRKQLYISRYNDMIAFTERYQFKMSPSILPLNLFMQECEAREADLMLHDASSNASIIPEDEITPCIEKCTPVSKILSTFISLNPRVQGISMDFFEYPENLDKVIHCYEQQIAYFHEQKEKYASRSSRHARTWSKTFDHWHNSKNPDFCAVDPSKEHLEKLLKQRDLILNFEPSVVNAIKEHPGILQKDMPALFDPEFEQRCFTTIRALANSGAIRRVRSGRSYSLFVNDVSSSPSQLPPDEPSSKSSTKE